MAKAISEMTVAELEKALNSRRERLEELVSRKTELERELEKVDAKIMNLAGGADVAGIKTTRRRPKNEKPLKQLIIEILGKTKRGFTLDELQQRVLEAGYLSNSANFRTVLYQSCYHAPEIARDEKSGRYVLEATE